MGDKIRIFLLFFLVIFLSSIASATFNVGSQNYSIANSYGPFGNITGWLNISFNSEPSSSVFQDSQGHSVNLSQILSQNPDYTYSCNPSDCQDNYLPSGGSSTKTFMLNAGESKFYGLNITGHVLSIDYINFTLDSNAPASCTNQVGIDFSADSSVDAINSNPLDSGICSSIKTYGCFNTSITSNEQPIVLTPYCEQVNLSASPGFLIGAWIKKVSGAEMINASIYNSYGDQIARCTLPDASTQGGEVSCGVDYSVAMPQTAYVCINTNGNSDYRTREYDSSDGCGFFGTPTQDFQGDYQIFAQGKSFGAVGSIMVNSSLSDGSSLAQIAEGYINQKYGMDCSAGCVVPIEINSGFNQSITLRNLQIRYTKSTGPVSDSNFYDVSVIPAKITSGFQQLYLDNAGFSLPNTVGNYSFFLNFNSQRVISQRVEIENVPIINLVTPLKTASAFPTQFNVSLSSPQNLAGFFWDFGDNSTAAGPGNSTTHTYDAVGIYNLTVTAINQNGLNSSKVFSINVTSPKDLISSSLNDMQASLTRVQGEIASYSTFDQQVLNSLLNLTEMQQELNYLNASYANASSDADYNRIVSALVELKIPDQVLRTGQATSLPFISGTGAVDLNAVQDIAGGNYTQGREQDYIDALFLWQQDNLNANFDFSEFSGTYGGYVSPIAHNFEFTFSEKKDIPYDYYLILPQMEGFQADSNFSTRSGYNYIDLKGKNSLSFSTTESIDPTNLPIFISPSLDQLSITPPTLPEEKTLSKWIIFIAIIIGIIVLAIIVYLLLRRWYDKRYENYLFKNRNDLYNMVNYINNAKRKGLKNPEIEENLKKAGWSSERIRYVMRKYAGKRTGML